MPNARCAANIDLLVCTRYALSTIQKGGREFLQTGMFGLLLSQSRLWGSLIGIDYDWLWIDDLILITAPIHIHQHVEALIQLIFLLIRLASTCLPIAFTVRLLRIDLS